MILDEHLPYQFRHDFWGRAVKAGVDSVVIAKQMGHTDLDMLVKHYAHVDTSQTKTAVELALPPSDPTEPEPKKKVAKKKKP
jgi:integrase